MCRGFTLVCTTIIRCHYFSRKLHQIIPGCRQEIYQQFDTKFTNIYQEKLYFLAKSNQQSIRDVSLFILAMFMSKNCSCLVSMSDDLDENVKSSSNVDSQVWQCTGDLYNIILFCICVCYITHSTCEGSVIIISSLIWERQEQLLEWHKI
jgi:hypothetical protein